MLKQEDPFFDFFEFDNGNDSCYQCIKGKMNCDGLIPCLNCMLNKTECKKFGEIETDFVDKPQIKIEKEISFGEEIVEGKNNKYVVMDVENNEMNLSIDPNKIETPSMKVEKDLFKEDIYTFKNNFHKEDIIHNNSPISPPSYSTNYEIEEQIESIRNKFNHLKENKNNMKPMKGKRNINQRNMNQLSYNLSKNPHPIKQNINNFYYLNKNTPSTSTSASYNITPNKKKKITYIQKIETIKTIETQVEEINEENEDTEDQEDQEIARKIEEMRYRRQMMKHQIEEMKNQRKELMPINFGNNLEEEVKLIPNVPSIFLPKLGIKSGTMYFTLTFEKDMPDNYYNPRNIVLEDVSENFAMTMGFPPAQILGIKLGFLTPNYSQEEMEKYSKGLLSVCKKDINYIRILSFRKMADGNIIAFDQVSVMYNYNGKPNKAFTFVKNKAVLTPQEVDNNLSARFLVLD